MADLFHGLAHFRGDLLWHGLPAQVLDQLALHLLEAVDRFHHMHRDPDRPGLVCQRPGDRLPDPPGGIGGKFVAFAVIELFHGAEQADIALLDQIQKRKRAAGEFLGD